MTFNGIFDRMSHFLDSMNDNTIALFFFGVIIFIFVATMIAERYRTRQMEALARELHCRFIKKRDKMQGESYTERNVIEGTWRGAPILIYDISIGRGDSTERQTVINGKHYAGWFLTYLSINKIRRVLAGDRTIPEAQNAIAAPPLPGATRVAAAVTKVGRTIFKMFALWFAISFIAVIVVYVIMVSAMFS